MPTCLVIGNLAERIEHKGKKKAVGIAGSYVSALVARRLGYDTTLVSKISPHFDKKILRMIEKEKIKLVKLPSWEDTKYEVAYGGGVTRKTNRIISDAGPIFNIPDNITGDVVMFTSYFGDIKLDVFKKVKNENNIVALNPQNFVKYRDPETSSVVYVPWLNKHEYLRYVDILKLNKDIYPFITGSANQCAVQNLITRKGALKVISVSKLNDWGYIFYKNKFFRSVIYTTKVKSMLGSGEAYLTAFAIRFKETGDPKEAMYFAVAAASIGVEKDITKNKAFNRKNVEKRTELLRNIYSF